MVNRGKGTERSVRVARGFFNHGLRGWHGCEKELSGMIPIRVIGVIRGSIRLLLWVSMVEILSDSSSRLEG